MPLVATVLPPGEGFGPGRTGAIGLLVQRFARVLPGLVIGGPQTGPVFPDIPFRPALPAWWGWEHQHPICGGGGAHPAEVRPTMVEVYNRPDIALALPRLLPRIPVCCTCRTTRRGMRLARTPRHAHPAGAPGPRGDCVRFPARRLLEGVARPSARRS